MRPLKIELESFAECVDKEDCSVYGYSYACSTEFVSWARIQCPAYCGLCSGKVYILMISSNFDFSLYVTCT